MKKLLWYTLNLQHFSGETEMSVEGETGDEIADAGQKTTQDCDQEFSELINGKFKEQFTKKTQAIIDRRFKETKELEEYKARISPVIEKLMDKFGLEAGNEEMLVETVNTNYKEGLAEVQENITPKQDSLKNKIGEWIKESEALKEKIPEFDLRAELKQSKLFSQLLLSGVPVDAAYETVHKNEIISNAMQYTADAVRQQMVQNIEAKGRRPVENGVSSESAIVTSVDVNSLTSKDILKILKQVENGANIKF